MIVCTQNKQIRLALLLQRQVPTRFRSGGTPPRVSCFPYVEGGSEQEQVSVEKVMEVLLARVTHLNPAGAGSWGHKTTIVPVPEIHL